VKAMRETKTMETLKEIRYDEYKKKEAKENELFIEEFTAHKAVSELKKSRPPSPKK
jgi:hypothetical protein